MRYYLSLFFLFLACCPKHGKLARSEITKGYEYEKGKYITIEQEDLQKIKLESTRTIEVIQFVNQSELDPVYIDTAYYVAPAMNLRPRLHRSGKALFVRPISGLRMSDTLLPKTGAAIHPYASQVRSRSSLDNVFA